MDKIGKIRKEIEALLNDWKYGSSLEAKYRCGAYRELLEYIDTLQEEPVSEDLEYASENYACRFTSSKYGHDKIKATFKDGANWQKAKDQETIELAEDHAMLAGMEKMKEQMMKDAVGGLWIRRNKHTKKNVLQCFDVTHEVFQKFKDGDKLKIIVIKDE